jgi:beta-galactosidase
MQVIEEMKRLSAPRAATTTPVPALAATATSSTRLGGRGSRRAAAALAATTGTATAAPVTALPTTDQRVGLLFDFDQLWYYASLPQSKRWDQPTWVTTWYGSLARLGLPIDILHPNRPWRRDPAVLVVPGLQMVDDAIVRALAEYAARGGHLVLTCRTATMDKTGQVFEGQLASPILDLIGGAIEAYDGLPDDVWGHIEMDGAKHRWGAWGELLYAEETTKVLARYADQFYKGAAAVIQRKHGQGTVTYCGVYAESSLTDAIVERVATTAKITSMNLPPRTQLLRREDHWVFMNYQDATVQAPAPVGAEFIVGDRRVEPAGVAIWRA